MAGPVRSADVPAPETHFYSVEADAPAPLYQGPVSLRLGQHVFRAVGLLEFVWRPSPRVSWTAWSNDPTIEASLFHEGDYVFPELQFDVNDLPQPPEAVERLEDVHWYHSDNVRHMTVGTSAGVSTVAVKFIVINLPRTLTAAPLRSGAHTYAGRTILEGAGWRITLDAAPNIGEIVSGLRASGGYSCTHVGRMERMDGTAFDSETSRGVLDGLRTILSFATGRAIGISLPVGYRADGAALWSDWGSPLVEEWRGANSVIDLDTGNGLHELASLVLDAWSDDVRRDVVRRAIGYFVRANDPKPVDIAVLLAQAGLEFLSWTELVDADGMATRAADQLRAHGRIRAILTRRNVATDLPANLSDLTDAAVAVNTESRMTIGDGPQLLTRMRNTVAHPKSTSPRFTTAQWIAAWRLSQSYLQLAILGYLGYSGTHRNPISDEVMSGYSEQVPWAST
jgi:hypothetical protein